eukprot:CAMPEP_0198547848 /NCGR_PEP_ID=MMETSP1462-20131121/68293_1 /TAXON_ID=1333877 /ORGANISM="Brandtodinium nutriculum, Strain RCC3387" /LENGTH=392 /DNA_ID=CAMNT_0044278349 /DNA_START=40 /DNA_END=1214 /DNA_ORIENTATION=+
MQSPWSCRLAAATENEHVLCCAAFASSARRTVAPPTQTWQRIQKKNALETRTLAESLALTAMQRATASYNQLRAQRSRSWDASARRVLGTHLPAHRCNREDGREREHASQPNALTEPKGVLAKPRWACRPTPAKDDADHADDGRDPNESPSHGLGTHSEGHRQEMYDFGNDEQGHDDSVGRPPNAKRVHEKQAVKELKCDLCHPDDRVRHGRAVHSRRALGQEEFAIANAMHPGRQDWPCGESGHRPCARGGGDVVTDAESPLANRTCVVSKDALLTRATDKRPIVDPSEPLRDVQIDLAIAARQQLGGGDAQSPVHVEPPIEDARPHGQEEEKKHREEEHEELEEFEAARRGRGQAGRPERIVLRVRPALGVDHLLGFPRVLPGRRPETPR